MHSVCPAADSGPIPLLRPRQEVRAANGLSAGPEAVLATAPRPPCTLLPRPRHAPVCKDGRLSTRSSLGSSVWRARRWWRVGNVRLAGALPGRQRYSPLRSTRGIGGFWPSDAAPRRRAHSGGTRRNSPPPAHQAAGSRERAVQGRKGDDGFNAGAGAAPAAPYSRGRGRSRHVLHRGWGLSPRPWRQSTRGSMERAPCILRIVAHSCAPGPQRACRRWAGLGLGQERGWVRE